MLQRQAAHVLLLLVVERHLAALLRPLLSLVAVVSVRQLQAMIAGELPRHHHELVVVEGNVAGLAALGVDARPDDMAVLARECRVLSFLTWKTTARGWPASPRRLLRAVDVFEILLLGEPPLPLVGIDERL